MTTNTSRFCPICRSDYGGSTVPALLTCCMRHVCYSCAETDRNTQISLLTGNKKLIRCIFCNQKYHSSKETPWGVNEHFIEYSGIDVDLTFVRETQAAMRAMVTNNQRRRSTRRPDGGATLRDNAAADNLNGISQDISRSSGQEQEVDGDENENNATEGEEIIANLSNNDDSPYAASTNGDAGTNLRRSQRSRRGSTQGSRLAGDGTQLSNDDVTANTRQARQQRNKREVAAAAAMPPAKRNKGRSRSKKQKEQPRQKLANDILFRLKDIGPTSKKDLWNVKLSSFKSTELLPLDFVELDKDKNRYQVTSSEENITEDDVILHAMVVFALYRMEKGWGHKRSIMALSVWGGKPANDAEDELFPLVNLWKEEIRQCISENVIGPTTLNHDDNFYHFPRFYLREDQRLPEDQRNRWKRRSNTCIGQVHLFAEQAAIQLALHLHENVSRDYAILSSLIIFTALRDEEDAEEQLSFYLNSLIDSSRKETDCFPKTALDDIFGKSSTGAT